MQELALLMVSDCADAQEPEFARLVRQAKAGDAAAFEATSSLRMRDGSGGETNGVLPSVGAGLMPTNYEFRVVSSAITSDSKERVIRIDGLKLALRVPIKTSDRDWSYQEAHINTSIDIREGQKVVVGKANIDNADNALILVLTAKVIE